jgi:hypothetical protein
VVAFITIAMTGATLEVAGFSADGHTLFADVPSDGYLLMLRLPSGRQLTELGRRTSTVSRS